MRILVCVKRVPAPGARINITADGQEVDTAHLAFTTSPHEECAVEAAAQLVEQHGGEATVLTLGPAEAEEQLRYAVSVGMQKAVLLPTNDGDWDPQRTAQAIAGADSCRSRRADGAFDLILFGNESADSGGFQVGIRVAHALGRPMVNGGKGLTIDGGAGARAARVRRRPRDVRAAAAGGGRRQGGHQPPALPDDEGPPGVEEGRGRHDRAERRRGRARTRCRCARPVEKRSETVILGTGPDAAPAVVDVLERDRGAVMSGSVLVVVEHDRGAVALATLEALTAAGRSATVSTRSRSVTPPIALAERAGRLRRRRPCTRRTTTLLADYGPEAWGEVVAQAVRALAPAVVLATGTDRGNEVLAQAAARLDLPFAANCTEFGDGEPLTLTRVRWGGSLLEQTPRSTADVKLVTVAHHAVDAEPAATPGRGDAGDAERDARSVAGPHRSSRVASSARPASRWRLHRSSSAAGAASARRRASPRCRSWRPSSAVSSGARAPSPTTAGATTPIRSARPAHASRPTSTSPAASPGRSSTGWARWRARTSSPSTPTAKPTW